MPCNDCSRTEKCPPCPHEEQGEPEKPCTCGPDEACGDPCTPAPVDCAHVGSRVIERSDAPENWTRYLCDDCGARWFRNWSRGGGKVVEPPRAPARDIDPELCKPCAAGFSMDCTCEHPEPPLTPEEEEEAPEGEAACQDCLAGAHGPNAHREPPPQPDRRPPYLLAYSVQGHLYEVALPGDAAVAALDGRLVITHQLGPVAGICQIAPITSEESAR